MTGKFILETARLRLRELSEGDADLIFELLTEPSFLRNIGDRGVRTRDDAISYIQRGPIDSYARHGFGMWLVERKDPTASMGMCGLIKRESLADVDIGFAFLPRFWGQGYARESAEAVMAYGRDTLGLERIVGIVNPDNDASIKVLEAIGLRYDRMIRLPGESLDIRLYSSGP